MLGRPTQRDYADPAAVRKALVEGPSKCPDANGDAAGYERYRRTLRKLYQQMCRLMGVEEDL